MRFSDEIADHIVEQAIAHARYARELTFDVGTGANTDAYPPRHVIAAQAWIRGEINDGQLLSKVKPKSWA